MPSLPQVLVAQHTVHSQRGRALGIAIVHFQRSMQGQLVFHPQFHVHRTQFLPRDDARRDFQAASAVDPVQLLLDFRGKEHPADPE